MDFSMNLEKSSALETQPLILEPPKHSLEDQPHAFQIRQPIFSEKSHGPIPQP